MELGFSSQDPVVGLIVVFAVLFLTALCSYLWGVWSSKKTERSLHGFVQKFQNTEGAAVSEFLDALKPNISLLKSLALTLQKVGNFEQVIAVYNYALLHSQDATSRRALLVLLGKAYLKAGFLKRAEGAFLACLQFGAREEEALRYLCLVYERLRDYKKCLEVLDSLREFGSDVAAQVAFARAMRAFGDGGLDVASKRAVIAALRGDFAWLGRLELTLCKKSGLPLPTPLPPLRECIDLVWKELVDGGAEFLGANGGADNAKFEFGGINGARGAKFLGENMAKNDAKNADFDGERAGANNTKTSEVLAAGDVSLKTSEALAAGDVSLKTSEALAAGDVSLKFEFDRADRATNAASKNPATRANNFADHADPTSPDGGENPADPAAGEWELRAVRALNAAGVAATLEFSYVCAECKNASPIFFYRCQNCARLGSTQIHARIAKETDDKSDYIF